MTRFVLIVSLVCGLGACDRLPHWVPGAWTSYEHPTYRFSLRVPSRWELIEDTPFGAAVLFRSPESGHLFRSTVNVLVEELKDPNIALEALSELSEKQLSMVLREYQVLSKAPLKLGSVPAREIRGKYFGTEGERRIRTMIALSGGLQYVLTISTSAQQEAELQNTFKRMLRSFRIDGS